MSITNYKKLQDFLSLEEKRLKYAKNRQYNLLKKSYIWSDEKNLNTGKFWDKSFANQSKDPFYLEIDRNQYSAKLIFEYLKKNGDILNVGCGNGKLEELLYTELHDKCKYTGIDVATKTLVQLKGRFPRFSFRRADLVKTKLGKNLFDLISIFEVLEHISSNDTFSVLNNILLALRPGGYLLLAVPLNEPLLEMFPSNPNEHMRRYQKELILAELHIAGFEIVSSREFFAFQKLYCMKTLLARYVLKNKWQANDIVIVARKPTTGRQ